MWLPRGRGGGGGTEWKLGESGCKFLRARWVNIKVLVFSTEIYIQHPGINCNGKEYKKEYIYMYICITESLCYTVEVKTTFKPNILQKGIEAQLVKN